ncbi:TIGR02444 family protein [Agaribacter flavus]
MLTAKAFWQYACEKYAQPEVKKACLFLQDSYQAQVNIVLLAMYMGSENSPLSGQHLLVLHKHVRHANETIVAHREARRSLKEQDDKKYQLALQQELRMEQALQKELIAGLKILPCSNASSYAQNNLLSSALNEYVEGLMAVYAGLQKHNQGDKRLQAALNILENV